MAIAQDITELERYYASLGMTPSEIQKVLTECKMRDLDIIQIRVGDLQKLLHVNQSDVVRIICNSSRLLSRETYGDKPTSIQSKIKQYQEILKTDEINVLSMIRSYPNMLGRDTISEAEQNEKSVKATIKQYAKILKTDEDKVRSMICLYPSMLGRDTISEAEQNEKSVKATIKQYAKILKTDEDRVRSMICSHPSMLGYDTISEAEQNEKSVKAKIKQYAKILKIDEDKVRSMICSYSAMISYDTISEAEQNEKSVKAKIKQYAKIFKTDEDTVISMILRGNPAMLGCDTISNKATGIKHKVAKLTMVCSLEQIIQFPSLLSTPALRFKIRYMLAVIIDTIKPGIMHRFWRDGKTGENKVWARYCGLKQNGADLAWVYLDEKRFQKRTGLNSEDLMQQYSLDLPTVHAIEAEYRKITGKTVQLDQEELGAMGLVGKQKGVEDDGSKTI